MQGRAIKGPAARRFSPRGSRFRRTPVYQKAVSRCFARETVFSYALIRRAGRRGNTPAGPGAADHTLKRNSVTSPSCIT